MLIVRTSPDRLTSWSTGARIAADVPGLEVRGLSVGRVSAPPAIATALDLPDGTQVVRRHRRYLTPTHGSVAIASSYLPEEVAGPWVWGSDTGPGGLYARLAEAGHAPVRFVEEVTSRLPTDTEAEDLGCGDGVAVLLVRRTATTSTARAVEVSEQVLRADVYLLRYHLHLPGVNGNEAASPAPGRARSRRRELNIPPEDLARRYRDGSTLAELAAEADVSLTTVRRRIIEHTGIADLRSLRTPTARDGA